MFFSRQTGQLSSFFAQRVLIKRTRQRLTLPHSFSRYHSIAGNSCQGSCFFVTKDLYRSEMTLFLFFFFWLLFIFLHYALSLSPCIITEAGRTGSIYLEMTGWAWDRKRNLRWQVVFPSLLNLASDVHLVMYRQLFPVHFELRSPWWIHILANIWSYFLFWLCWSCSMNVSSI